MWVPKNADDIENAAKAGDLTETPTFDAKEALPATASKNRDLAEDVAAMTTDGGVLLYGVGEDANKRPTIPKPIKLAGVSERIDQIVQNSISEAPYIDVREYPCGGDPARGYIAVIVPQSARAPHQVTVGKDFRFYGRGATGNRRLNEGEVARLYQRRQEWQQDRDQLLAECIAAARYGPSLDRGYLHAFARPVAPDPALWDRALERSGGRKAFLDSLAIVAAETGPAAGYQPSLHGGTRWQQLGADSWKLTSLLDDDADGDRARYVVDVVLNIDGRGRLFCGRAAERLTRTGPSRNGRLIIFESIIAGNFASFLSMLRAFFDAAGYFGHVDLGLAVTGIAGGFSDTIPDHGFYMEPYNAQTYPRTERVAAAELHAPETVARRMLRHLVEATTGRDGFDPFA